MPITSVDDEGLDQDVPWEEGTEDEVSAADLGEPDDGAEEEGQDEEVDEPDYSERSEYRATDEEIADAGFTREELDQHPRLQKRINRLTWERNHQRELTAEALAKMQELENRFGSFEASQQYAQQASEHSSKMEQLQSKRSDIQDRIRKAYADGELDNVGDLQIELADVTADLKMAERNKPEEPKAPEPKNQPPQSQEQSLTPAAAAWVARNSSWFDDPANQRYRQLAATLEKQLLDKGFRPDEDRTYRELDKAMKKQAPGLYKTEPKKPSGPPSAAQRRGSPPNQKRQQRRLTQEDLRSMQRYGLNPRDPEARKAWLLQDAPLD